MSSVINHFYRFGNFAIDTEQRVLLQNGKPVSLTPKVFETLLLLIEHRGRIVEKSELMNLLWSDSFVEEANLTVNIQQLRKALGDNARKPTYVETVARRGYRFIAEVEEVLTDTSVIQTQRNVELNGFETEREKQEDEAVIVNQPEFETQLINAETKNIPVISSITNRRVFFIGASLVILFGIGLFVLRFGSASSENHKDKKTIFGSYASLSALKIEKLTATGKSSNPVISPDGKFVAYINETKGQSGIWLRQLATNTSREIVPASDEIIGGLAFARNSESLYFARSGVEKQLTLYRVSLIGGLPTKLITQVQGTFSLSPDNRQIAFIRYSDDDKKCALMVANEDGSNERELVLHDQPDRFYAPAWSPDGQSIMVAVGPSDSGSQEVCLVEVNIADGSKKELPADRWFHIKRLEWLSNKDSLIISGAKKAGDSTQLWRISYPSGEVRQIAEGLNDYQNISITADAKSAVAAKVTLVSDLWVGENNEVQSLRRITQAINDLCWMPDGQIVYSSTASVRKDLWIMKPDGTEQRQLTNVGLNGSPMVSTDGRYIVFISNRSGSFQVWRMDTDGNNQVQLTNVKGAHNLSISPDGQWIVYSLADSWQLWKISINGGEPALLTQNSCIYPSVSPDGKQVACIGKDEKSNRKLLIFSFESGQLLKELNFATPKLSATRLRWTSDSRAVIYAASHNRLASLYKQTLNRSAPEKILGLNDNDVFDFGYSHDGKYLAAIRGSWQFDVVLIKGLNQ